MDQTPRRRAVSGLDALAQALAEGEPVRAVFATRDALEDRAAASLVESARQAGAVVHVVGASVLRRFARGEPRASVLALVGPPLSGSLDEMLSLRGAAWLLVGVSYATNAGFALRTAEVSGADGVVVDSAFSAGERRTALRASMRADRLMPVFWARADATIAAARRASRRVLAVEDSGGKLPWEADLARPALLVVGGERAGIPRAVLDLCEETIRVPMAGFIPSYNLQAAMAAVAVERLRQLGAR